MSTTVPFSPVRDANSAPASPDQPRRPVLLPAYSPEDDVEKSAGDDPLPRAITIAEEAWPGPSHDRDLRRYGSRGQADMPSRMIGEFRTLSIHVTDSQQITSAVAPKKKDVKDLTTLDWHTISVEEAATRLNVALKVGLDNQQAARRLKTNGPNAMSPPPNNRWKKWLGYIFGGFGTLLLVAAILCFIAWKPLGEPNPAVANLALAIVLIIVILVQTVFNAWQDWSTSRTMNSIKDMLPSDVLAVRDGDTVTIPAKDIVTGDIVHVRLGDKLPADLRFIDVSSDFKVDRSVLTGESEPIAGVIDSTDTNFLETKNIGLQGTLCVSGNARGMVIQTGDNTVFGRIAKLSSTARTGLTTLQREILRFIIIIVTLAISLAVLFIVLWAAWLNKKHKGFITVAVLVIDVVSVCVAFIPEGLPASITISLAVIANTLSKNKILCKSLMTVETLGAVDVLCSDKTGTLTCNRMTVTRVAVGALEVDVEQARDMAKFKEDEGDGLRQLGAIAGVCNGASFDAATIDQPIHSRTVNGDATDSAILRFAETVRPVYESNADWEEIHKVSFNSKSKFMLKLLRPLVNGTGIAANLNDTVLMSKGAPDVLMPRCKFVVSPDGSSKPLDSSALAQVNSIQEAWAAKGMRVLLLAKRIIPSSDMLKSPSHDSAQFADFVAERLHKDLTIVGLVGLVDPPRADIPHTVKTMRGAGVRFLMVTGDFATTALAIAEQCGIVSNSATTHRVADLPRHVDGDIPIYDREAPVNSLVLSGTDLMEMSDDQWSLACSYTEIVFARTTPEQKLRIVKEFQKRGSIVGMTGDGVNDAPSLKAADIGIAMGGGSDVAMEAADLVLLQDFSAITVAVEYGRLVFDNLRKTCLYLLPAGTFSELMPILLNILLGLPQILSSLQMIIICIFTDVFPAIALCHEKPEAGLLTRPPRNVKKDRLVDAKFLLHAYGFLGIPESLCAMSMSFWWLDRQGFKFKDLVLAYGGLPSQYDADAYAEAVNVAQSIYFFTLVGMQWGNLLSTRTRRLSIFQHNPFYGPARNIWIVPAMLASLGFLFFFSYVPFFQRVFLTRGVPVEHIFIPFTFAIGILFLDETRKYFVRKYPKGFLARIAW